MNPALPSAAPSPDAEVSITILLDTRSFGGSRRYDPAEEFVEAYSYRYRPAAGRTSDQQILETQFELFNDQTPSIHAAVYYSAGNRSLSVGDIVDIDNRRYRCASDGWTPIPPPDPSSCPPHRFPGPVTADTGHRTARTTLVGLDLPEVGAVTVLADVTDQGHQDLAGFARNLAHHLARYFPDQGADPDLATANTHS